MRTINFTDKDMNTIAMALIDNAVIGRLNKNEYSLAWDILERLYEPVTLSKTDLVLICDSLDRYAMKYEYEVVEARECRRVYKIIMEACRNE